LEQVYTTQYNIKQIFIHEPDVARSPLTRDNVTETECRGWLMRIHTCVKEKGGYFANKL